MKTLYIERSCGNGRDGHWTDELDLDDVGRIVVGMGPGSFAGIRAALAFAQGFSLGRRCEVFGIPSPCAVAAILKGVRPFLGWNGKLAVVGDARRGKTWVALFDGLALVRDIFQVAAEEIHEAIPPDMSVVTVDEARIGEKLKNVFGERYLGGRTPTAEGLKAFAEANPSALVREPLPIYLNPAVRD